MEQPPVHHPVRDGLPAGGGEPGRRHPQRRRTDSQGTQGRTLSLLSIL